MVGKALSVLSRQFIDRTRIARKTAGVSVKAMATALAIGPDEYRKFERGAELSARHLLVFCALARVSPLYLLTGERRPITSYSPLVQQGTLAAPQNRCGAPCPLSSHWCKGECTRLQLSR